MKVDVPGKKYVQTVERLVDWGLTSHQQLRSYGDEFIVPSNGLENLRPLVYKASGHEGFSNCGEEKHCSDDRNFEKAAKCVNCSGSHPTFSHDCPTWHKEKELLKIKYTRNLPFIEVRKIVEQQSSTTKKVQVGKDQEKAQSERDSDSKNRGGKKPN